MTRTISRRSLPLPHLDAILAAVLIAAPFAACQTADQGNGTTAATDPESTMTPDDGYTDRMAAEHTGDSPVAGAAAEAGDTADVRTDQVVYSHAGGGDVHGYLARPQGAPTDGPGLIVIHEWWGLNDNVETMARMFAQHGYTALAVDLYGGEVAETPDQAQKLMRGVDESTATQNLKDAYEFLVGQGAVNVGVIGWCFGGGWSLQTALALPDEIDGTVIYYGHLTTDRTVLAKLGMPILAFFGAEDSSIPQDQVHAFESTLKELGKSVEVHVYPNAGHAFANPSGERYVPEAARDAWQRTLAFLDAHVKGVR